MSSSLEEEVEHKRVLTFGVFDPLHEGHLNLFKQAKGFGDWLLVVVARDSFIRAVKKREPFINETERAEKVRLVEEVDEVILGDEWPVDDPYGLLGKLDFDVVALGYDQNKSEERVISQLREKEKLNVKVVRLKPFFPDKYKSSYQRSQS